MDQLDILVAHPLKHHVYHLAAGFQNAGLRTELLVPLYRKGLARLFSVIPGNVGNKTRGYNYDRLRNGSIVSPAFWQLKRLLTSSDNIGSFQHDFDIYVAGLIARRKIRPRVLVTMQDYMPNSVAAAKAVGGILIWSDQILNRSDPARLRINQHLQSMDASYADPHDESNNNRILGIADIVTCPSTYTYEGLISRISPKARVYKIPYGVSEAQFSGGTRANDSVIRILARANGVRKGGHLLLSALSSVGAEMLKHAGSKQIEVVIVGKMEFRLEALMREEVWPVGIVVKNVVVPHLLMPQLLASSDLFVMPSLSEGMSLIGVEAMLMHLPAVLTPFCGLDCFRHLEMGLIVEDNVDSLGAGLVKALASLELWPEWGMKGHLAAGGLTWDAYENAIKNAARELG